MFNGSYTNLKLEGILISMHAFPPSMHKYQRLYYFKKL